MTTVWVTTSEHPEQPGTRISVSYSPGVAIREAARYVNLIRDSSAAAMGSELPPVATADNWESVMEQLADWHGAGGCYTDVTQVTVLV